MDAYLEERYASKVSRLLQRGLHLTKWRLSFLLVVLGWALFFARKGAVVGLLWSLFIAPAVILIGTRAVHESQNPEDYENDPDDPGNGNAGNGTTIDPLDSALQKLRINPLLLAVLQAPFDLVEILAVLAGQLPLDPNLLLPASPLIYLGLLVAATPSVPPKKWVRIEDLAPEPLWATTTAPRHRT